MRLVGERIAVAENLSRDLKQHGRKATKQDLATIRELIADEQESMDKSARIASTDTYQENYRQNMRKAAANSKTAIGLLNKALEAIRSRDVLAASDHLAEVVALRGKKATQSRGGGAAKLYVQYQMLSDTAFHSWLQANGHTEALGELGVSVASQPKRTRQSRSESNQPENFEKGY